MATSTDELYHYNKDSETLEFCQDLDKSDALARFRSEFAIPKRKDVSNNKDVQNGDDPCIYMCGNSLGLMPLRSRDLVMQEFEVWGEKGVEAHWDHKYNRPWASVDETVKDMMANIVGAKPIEVTTMNTLTGNIHSLLAAFYQPTAEKNKIIIEKKAFPSDHYAVESQIKLHGYDPKSSLITIAPREGEDTLHTEDILAAIEKHGSSTAVIMLSGVQYYTGQWFEMEKITAFGHEQGCIVGWDLAHAAGNVPVQLHDWNVDFACWCSYKYLNSSPGGIAGLFVHEKYAHDTSRPRLQGWWGNEKESRFEMKEGKPDFLIYIGFRAIKVAYIICHRSEFVPTPGASGYQLSNPSVLATTCLLGSLQVFTEAGFSALREKSIRLTGYLEYLAEQVLAPHAANYKIITPKSPLERGCQLSFTFEHGKMMDVFNGLQANGLICDERKPTCIRLAPTPLYNSFTDVYHAVHTLKNVMDAVYGQQ
ncbi:hypothetical protein INT43_001413 [Umbelopsis isabellina]|uniref:Kynureninase n=1 Tax=Mortierella isabellina TaxID=91625 RepID=A0A8H7U8F6_MORIS|nr:hypothetical protein INT43_001413 [Umbelopsis isabellina]